MADVAVLPLEHTAGFDTLAVTVELEFFASVVQWRVAPRVSDGWHVVGEAADGFIVEAAAEGMVTTPTFLIASTGGVPLELVLEIEVTDRDRVYHGDVVRRFFDLAGDLVEIPGEVYTARHVVARDGALETWSTGTVAEAPSELRHLDPQDNPALSDDQKAQVAAHLAARAEGTAQASGALIASGAAVPEARSPVAGGAAGCEAGSSGGPLGLVVIIGIILVVGVRRRRVLALVVLVGLPVAVIATPSDADAVTHSVYGTVSFWDTRAHGSTDVGARMKLCAPQYTACNPHPSNPWCCFTGIPAVRVDLFRMSSPPTVVDSFLTDGTGFFFLSDPNWQPVEYRIVVHYTRTASYPASFELLGQFGSSHFYTIIPGIDMTQQTTYLPNVSVNPAGDTNSIQGDLASIWATAYSTLHALEWEGETRHRKKFGSVNAYDPILTRYYSFVGASNASCGLSTVTLNYGNARNHVMPHELGHIYHGRVVGCNGGGLAYPQQVDNGHSWHTGEGQALQEGIASITMALNYWDPSVAAASSVRAHLFDCYVDSYDNTNRVSSERNNWLGMWELLDAEVNSGSGYTDYVSESVVDIMDGLVRLQNANGSPGQNRTNAEAIFNATGTGCFNSEDCAAGDVCFGIGQCRTGDPHGENVRDWIYHIAAHLGVSDADYWRALATSPCVGVADNSYPFTGGYRAD